MTFMNRIAMSFPPLTVVFKQIAYQGICTVNSIFAHRSFHFLMFFQGFCYIHFNIMDLQLSALILHKIGGHHGLESSERILLLPFHASGILLFVYFFCFF